MFWIGQILLGSVVPLLICLHSVLGRSRALVVLACVLVVLGGLAQMYVTIIGGQAYPMPLLAGKEVIASSFFDGVVAPYRPSAPELLLGVGGVAIALLMVVLGVRVLPFLPQSLADAVADPHHPAP
jgi:molybdopterin-containing oxidoreductase family membrane subunit